MDAQEFLISAREMLQKGREVDYRNAASRAYYAAYHVSREKFGPASESTTFGATHEKLIRDLLAHPDKEFKKIGNTLNQLKKIRTHADYHLHKPFSAIDARRVLEHARRLTENPRASGG